MPHLNQRSGDTDMPATRPNRGCDSHIRSVAPEAGGSLDRPLYGGAPSLERRDLEAVDADRLIVGDLTLTYDRMELPAETPH